MSTLEQQQFLEQWLSDPVEKEKVYDALVEAIKDAKARDELRAIYPEAFIEPWEKP